MYLYKQFILPVLIFSLERYTYISIALSLTTRIDGFSACMVKEKKSLGIFSLSYQHVKSKLHIPPYLPHILWTCLYGYHELTASCYFLKCTSGIKHVLLHSIKICSFCLFFHSVKICSLFNTKFSRIPTYYEN
jgi:hypothetical protein